MTDLICIVCPRGCHLKVDDKMNVTGNFCPRGKQYALSELTNPVRMITSTVDVENRINTRLSIATSMPIPKNKIFEVMEIIRKTKVSAPIQMGDIVVSNVLNLHVDLIATKEIK